ncbi:MAG: hypothetical protein KAW45_02790 [Thermoplasmatales archaeon]|nr:hypothetical protein [Thermoplasmatales archaeon]
MDIKILAPIIIAGIGIILIQLSIIGIIIGKILCLPYTDSTIVELRKTAKYTISFPAIYSKKENPKKYWLLVVFYIVLGLLMLLFGYLLYSIGF